MNQELIKSSRMMQMIRNFDSYMASIIDKDSRQKAILFKNYIISDLNNLYSAFSKEPRAFEDAGWTNRGIVSIREKDRIDVFGDVIVYGATDTKDHKIHSTVTDHLGRSTRHAGVFVASQYKSPRIIQAVKNFGKLFAAHIQIRNCKCTVCTRYGCIREFNNMSIKINTHNFTTATFIATQKYF